MAPPTMPEWIFDLDAWVNWMLVLPPFWGYVIVLTIAYGENVVPPIPGDMIVVLGGYLAGLGHLHFGLVVLLATVGGAAGFMTMYSLGRVLDRRLIENPNRYAWIPRDGIGRAQQWLQRYGYGVVAANRFLSGARSVISIAVGMARMSAWKTFFFCTVSAFVWTALIAYAGYAIGDNWPVIAEYLQTYGRVVIVLLVVVAVGWGAWWYWGSSGPDGEGTR